MQKINKNTKTNKVAKRTRKQDIQILIARFRFLNRIQIQTFLHHKDKSTINKWLKKLREHNALDWIYSEKLGENIQSAIYFTDSGGIKWLKTQDLFSSNHIQKLYREHSRKESFITRSLLVADISLDLEQKNTKSITYNYILPSEFDVLTSSFDFLTKLSPHLLYSKQTDKIKKYYLLEVFDEKLKERIIGNRIKKYCEFYFSNAWENNLHTEFPSLLFVLPSIDKLIVIKQLVRKILKEAQVKKMDIFVSTADEVKEHGVTSPIWEEVR